MLHLSANLISRVRSLIRGGRHLYLNQPEVRHASHVQQNTAESALCGVYRTTVATAKQGVSKHMYKDASSFILSIHQESFRINSANLTRYVCTLASSTRN